MTKKVYLNPDRLDTAINSLTYLADDAETAKTNIDNQFSAEGDPMGPSTDLFTIGNSIETVRGLVSTLTSFKQAILDANNSGVGSMDAGGGITIELSDNASVNSPEQVNACIRAAADATDLAAIQAGKNPKSKRSYEEIMESLRANQDDAAYADGIIDSIGLDALTAFPLRNSEHSSEIAEILGKLLATASTAWSEDRSNEVAEAMVESVDGDQVNEYGRITALNTMLGRHDADGDHVDDLNFNTTFLTSLAEGLGNIDPAAVNVEVHKAGVFSRLGAFIPDVSMDPMAGVLDAMGNNPQAALNYLAPASEDGSVDVSRIDGLSTRDWGQEGLSGFTAPWRRPPPCAIVLTRLWANGSGAWPVPASTAWRRIRERSPTTTTPRPTSACCWPTVPPRFPVSIWGLDRTTATSRQIRRCRAPNRTTLKL